MYLESCDDRLKAKIENQADEMLRDVWQSVFQILDSLDYGRFTIKGGDAGRLAQMAVNAIRSEVAECLAK